MRISAPFIHANPCHTKHNKETKSMSRFIEMHHTFSYWYYQFSHQLLMQVNLDLYHWEIQVRWRDHPARISVLKSMSRGQLSRRRIKLQRSDPIDIVTGDIPDDDQRMEEDRVAEVNGEPDDESEHEGEKTDESEHEAEKTDESEHEAEKIDGADGGDQGETDESDETAEKGDKDSEMEESDGADD